MRRWRRRPTSTFAGSGGVRWLTPVQRRRRRRLPVVPLLVALLVLGAAAGAYALVRADRSAEGERREVAERFVQAWERGDVPAMWRETSARTREEWPLRDFRSSYRAATRAAGVEEVRVGAVPEPRDGVVAIPVAATTRDFGTLRGVLRLPVAVEGDGDDEAARVRWSASLRLPGLRPGEQVRRKVLSRPRRASVLAADGRRLASTPAAAAIAGTAPAGEDQGSGLEVLYEHRLGGTAGAELWFGGRRIAKVAVERGRSVKTTIRPGLQRATVDALGDRVGGIAVVKPSSGDILALAGLGVSGPQPPGSTFKIITLAAALQEGIARPSSSYPVRQFTTLSGVKLRNASNESCGGSLSASFAHSCNSVFAPLGAKLGARKLVRAAERFGFNEELKLPGFKLSSIPAAGDLRDSLAVGASAIGQDRDLATALTMASVGATIANRGVRARPRIVRGSKVKRRRVVSAKVARQVRDMMVAVVQGGTGTAAALPGVTVAGKTGTAELRPTADGPADPRNTDAWFVAFAPASSPDVAVAVMLVGAGQGGAAAAPIARKVLAAAL